MNKVLDDLIKISLSEASASLKFQNNLFIHEKIQDITSDRLTIAYQRRMELFPKSNPLLSQMNRDCLLIILFPLSSPDLVMSVEASPDDLITQLRQYQPYKPHIIGNVRPNSCHMQFSNKFVIRKSR